MLLDYLTRDAEATDAAEQARQEADQSFMPQSEKANSAIERFKTIMERSQSACNTANGLIPDAAGTSLDHHVGERYAKIAGLLHRSAAARDEADAAAFERHDPSMTAAEYWHDKRAFQKSRQRRSPPSIKIASIGLPIGLLASTSRRRPKQRPKPQRQNHRPAVRKAQKPRKTGFDGTPTPCEHKFMWADKNGKVYRHIVLPDLARRQSQGPRKYRNGER